MTLLKEGRNINCDLIFYRENADSHGRKRRTFLKTSVNLKCWNEEDFKNFSIKVMVGRTGRMVRFTPEGKLVPEPMLRIFLVRPYGVPEFGANVEPISINGKYDGVTITIDSDNEQVITSKEAFELISTGKVLFTDADFQPPWIEAQ
jgi:hypothetical protein